MSCNDASKEEIEEAFLYLSTRKQVLRELRAVVSQAAEETRSCDGPLREKMDMSQAIIHDVVDQTWRSMLEKAEGRFEAGAVSMALRRLDPF